MFEHEHDFRPWPDKFVLYCPCGATIDPRSAVASRPAATSRSPRRRTPQPPGAPQQQEFKYPTARELMDSPAPPPNVAQLDAQFGGADPMAQAEQLAEFADRIGITRPEEGDPKGTYRPGTSESPPWMKAPA